MYDLGFVLVESRPFVVLDGLPGLYGLKYDNATAYGLSLYLCSYKLVGFATQNKWIRTKAATSEVEGECIQFFQMEGSRPVGSVRRPSNAQNIIVLLKLKKKHV